jgi:hypothetical protein
MFTQTEINFVDNFREEIAISTFYYIQVPICDLRIFDIISSHLFCSPLSGLLFYRHKCAAVLLPGRGPDLVIADTLMPRIRGAVAGEMVYTWDFLLLL